MRQIFLAGEESKERSALQSAVIPNRSPEHRICRLNRIQYGPLRNRALDLDRHFAPDVRQGTEMLRKLNSNHGWHLGNPYFT
jgi:hypothetical protein